MGFERTLFLEEQYAQRIWTAMGTNGAACAGNKHLAEGLKAPDKRSHLLRQSVVGAGVRNEHAVEYDVIAILKLILHILVQGAIQPADIFAAYGHAAALRGKHLNAGLNLHERCAKLHEVGATTAGVHEFKGIQHEAGADLIHKRLNFGNNRFRILARGDSLASLADQQPKTGGEIF